MYLRSQISDCMKRILFILACAAMMACANGTPYYKEASVVVECETMTAWHQTTEDFRNGTPKEWYNGFEAGIHTVYIGEVLGAWKRN